MSLVDGWLVVYQVVDSSLVVYQATARAAMAERPQVPCGSGVLFLCQSNIAGSLRFHCVLFLCLCRLLVPNSAVVNPVLCLFKTVGSER